MLQDCGVITPKVKEGYRHVFHLYVIKSNDREHLVESLKEKGVETAIHYPTALPFLACYQKRDFKSTDFPAAFFNQSRILSLPLFAELTQDQIQYVSDIIRTS
jgi:dTDP-4-amino-4,6-dideoxygalactose transaminase